MSFKTREEYEAWKATNAIKNQIAGMQEKHLTEMSGNQPPTTAGQWSVRFILVAVSLLIIFAPIILQLQPSPCKPLPVEMQNAFYMSQVFVQKKLAHPYTAKWPRYYFLEVEIHVLTDNRYRIFSYVDAKNDSGKMVRIKYVCELEDVGGGNWKLITLQRVGKHETE